MLYYRLYFLSVQDGHIQRFAEIEAADDEAAIGEAERLGGEQPMELWCSARKVRFFEPSVVG